MKKTLYILGAIILLVVIAGIIKFNFINDDVYVPDGNGGYVNKYGKTAEFEEEAEKAMMKDDKMMDDKMTEGKAIMGNPLTKNTQLKDVTGKSASGMAYVLRTNNTLQHYIEATLPEPAKGNKYEGWLVRKTPTLKFFSTGTMTKEANGKYTLLFSVDDFDNYTKGYDFVVVTEEAVIDETPETHILEGTIK